MRSADPAIDQPDTEELRARRIGFWLYTAHLATIWGLALSNVLLGLTFLWTWHHRRQLNCSDPRLVRRLLPMAIYALFLVTSVLASMDVMTSLDGLGELYSLLSFALGVFLLRDASDVRWLLRVLCGMFVALSLFGLGQYYLGGFEGLHERITGPLSHYQTFAGILLIGNVMLFASLITRGRHRKWWIWPSLLVINWALLLTLTRGAWVATVVAFALGAIWVLSRRSFKILGAVVLILATVFLISAPNLLRQRVASIVDLQDPSNYDRLCMLEAGLYMISERPFFGLGPEMVQHRYPIYRHPTAPRQQTPHLHNALLQLAAERGLLSLAAYFALFWISIRRAWVAYGTEGRRLGPSASIYVGVILALLAFNVAGLFENNWEDTEVQRLVLCLLSIPIALASPRAAPSPSGSESLDDPAQLQPVLRSVP